MDNELIFALDLRDGRPSYICRDCVAYIAEHEPAVIVDMIVDYNHRKTGPCTSIYHVKATGISEIFNSAFIEAFQRIRDEVGRPLSIEEAEYVRLLVNQQLIRHMSDYKGQ